MQGELHTAELRVFKFITLTYKYVCGFPSVGGEDISGYILFQKKNYNRLAILS